uniref:Uncharacterized protein n=1 Tax=Timema monikensis TaxID=170555 RepID=A0A7R9EBB0_9NEOP|nr:unnamed protein product [Timema monikensis]
MFLYVVTESSISYKITGGNLEDVFNVKETTGAIFVSGPLDYETRKKLTSDSQHLGIYSSPMASLVLTDSSQLTSDSQHLGIYSSPMASLVLTDSSQLTSDSQHLGIFSSHVASLVLTDSSQMTYDSQHLGIYSSHVASLVMTDSSQLTSDSQHLGIYSSPMASLVLTDSSQLTSDSQHLGIYSSHVAYLVLTDSSQLTSDSQQLVSPPRLFSTETSNRQRSHASSLLPPQERINKRRSTCADPCAPSDSALKLTAGRAARDLKSRPEHLRIFPNSALPFPLSPTLLPAL